MFDPNEAFENESDDNEYDPMDDDLAFDSDFLNKVPFNDVVSFLETISEAIFKFEKYDTFQLQFCYKKRINNIHFFSIHFHGSGSDYDYKW